MVNKMFCDLVGFQWNLMPWGHEGFKWDRMHKTCYLNLLEFHYEKLWFTDSRSRMGRFHQRWEIFDDIWDILLRHIRLGPWKGKSSTPKMVSFSVYNLNCHVGRHKKCKRQMIDPSWCFFSIAMFVRLFVRSLTEFIPGERSVVDVATIWGHYISGVHIQVLRCIATTIAQLLG